ncbi:uncharacterized protein LOC133180700 [Saccostrea echinata]|uniref:uncharacterized protein LOC133180700 n=1 Tax=Saccostrea echinata TaxID=191078 RepID=UPI002A809663|nr:uncharacterized protein LOC133180700 [Saccostrea echinata]
MVSHVTTLEDGYFKALHGIRIKNYGLSVPFPYVSDTHCCLICLQQGNCQSANVHEREGLCELNKFGPQDSGAVTEVNQSWSVYYKSNVEDRELMLRATSGVGFSVRDTWLGTLSPPPPQDGCKSMASAVCTTHYRNPKIDLWETLSISEVMIELYKNGSRVMFMTFNGTGSNLESWMSSSRLLTSSWTTLSPTRNFIYFSVKGDQPCSRVFLILQNYGGCPKDAGWFVVLDPISSDCCPGEWSDLSKKPKFVYSALDNVARYQSTDVDFADVMAVFVKYT